MSDSKPALGEGPKVFMLAMATSFKGNPLLLGVSSQGCSPGRNRFFIFYYYYWELFYYLIKITHYRKADMPLYDNLGLDISTHHQMSKQTGGPQRFPVCLPKPLLSELL